MQYFISHYNKECELTIPEDLIIYDTTLRDGEQTPGVCFSFEDKIEIAHKLDQFKINQIEAGFPIVSERERESVSAIAKEGLDADILALTRTKPEDIDAALDCDVDGVITFVEDGNIYTVSIATDNTISVSGVNPENTVGYKLIQQTVE